MENDRANAPHGCVLYLTASFYGQMNNGNFYPSATQVKKIVLPQIKGNSLEECEKNFENWVTQVGGSCIE